MKNKIQLYVDCERDPTEIQRQMDFFKDTKIYNQANDNENYKMVWYSKTDVRKQSRKHWIG